MSSPTLISGPFNHERSSVRKTMFLVIAALLPATLFGLYQFGLPAILLFMVTIIAALLAETICLMSAGKPIRLYLFDGSALLTGWLLAMTLPPWAPWWIGVVGSLLAIIVGKHVFGGLGQNLFNPAMVARVALLISFPLEMTTWVTPQPLFSVNTPDLLQAFSIVFNQGNQLDAVSSASLLGHIKTELGRDITLSTALNGFYSPFSMGFGNVAGSLGETSAILLLAGGVFLLLTRVISWHIPVAMLTTLGLLATISNLYAPERYPDAIYHLLSGGAILGAFFIATDLVTSPVTRLGQLIFGAGIGLLVFIIRTWAGYPEGMGFAVLLMNAMTPLIDHYFKPRIYGRDGRGQPLRYEDTGNNG